MGTRSSAGRGFAGILVGFLLLCLPCSLAAGAGASSRTWAIVVGISDYLQPSYNTEWLAEEAAELKSALVRQCGVSETRVSLLTNSGATKKAIAAAFARLTQRVAESDVVLFYFSGHGTRVRDANGDEDDGLDEGLLPYDGKAGVADSLIIDDTLADWLNGLPCRVALAIIDTCWSGGQGKGVDGAEVFAKGTVDSVARDVFASGRSRPGRVLLSAARPEQFAYVDASLQHSVLTYYLLRAIDRLRGDRDGDGFVTVRELAAYSQEGVMAWAQQHDKVQNPGLDGPTTADLQIAPSLGAEYQRLANGGLGSCLSALHALAQQPKGFERPSGTLQIIAAPAVLAGAAVTLAARANGDSVAGALGLNLLLAGGVAQLGAALWPRQSLVLGKAREAESIGFAWSQNSYCLEARAELSGRVSLVRGFVGFGLIGLAAHAALVPQGVSPWSYLLALSEGVAGFWAATLPDPFVRP